MTSVQLHSHLKQYVHVLYCGSSQLPAYDAGILFQVDTANIVVL